MEVDSSLGDLSKMKYLSRSLDIGNGRGEMMMGYPTGTVNAIPKLPILSIHEEMVHNTNTHR